MLKIDFFLFFWYTIYNEKKKEVKMVNNKLDKENKVTQELKEEIEASEKKQEKLYNDITKAIFINIYTLSNKGTEDLFLKKFDIKDKNHLVFLEIAKSSAGMLNYTIYVDMNWLSYFLFKRKGKNTSIRRYRKNPPRKEVDIHEVLEFTAKGFGKSICIFSDIYEAFYEGKG